MKSMVHESFRFKAGRQKAQAPAEVHKQVVFRINSSSAQIPFSSLHFLASGHKEIPRKDSLGSKEHSSVGFKGRCSVLKESALECTLELLEASAKSQGDSSKVFDTKTSYSRP